MTKAKVGCIHLIVAIRWVSLKVSHSEVSFGSYAMVRHQNLAVGYVNLFFQVLVELHYGDKNPCNYICSMVSESLHERSTTQPPRKQRVLQRH